MKSALLSLLLGGKYASAASGGGWDYDHQDEWANDYSMCDNNDNSPIDIHTDDVVNDDTICSRNFEWDLDYNHTTFRMWNNGYALGLQAVTPSVSISDGDVSGSYTDADDNEYYALSLNEDVIGRFPNYFIPWGSDHEEFCLDSFHFHWGTSDLYGSEHWVDGGAYPLEVHFVHYSCEHASLGSTLHDFETEEAVKSAEALNEDVHQLGVVGIFFDVVNASNPAFDAIFEHLDDVQYPGKRDADVIVEGLDLMELIPDQIETAGYYAYEGSLTTPPCTDIVRWHVMNARGTIGVEQMDKFRQLLSDAYGSNAAPNYREVQDNVNTVYACMEGESVPTVEADEDDSTTFAVIAIYGALIMICQCAMGLVCCWRNKRRSNDKKQPMVQSTSTPTAGGATNGHH